MRIEQHHRTARFLRCDEVAHEQHAIRIEPGHRFVSLPDPPRAKPRDYRQAAADWHAERAGVWAGGLAALLYGAAYTTEYGYWHTAQPDGYVGLPLALALWLGGLALRAFR